MRVVDDEGAIYIVKNCNDIVLSIPYYIKTEHGIEDPYTHDKEGAMKLATKIIEECLDEV